MAMKLARTWMAAWALAAGTLPMCAMAATSYVADKGVLDHGGFAYLDVSHIAGDSFTDFYQFTLDGNASGIRYELNYVGQLDGSGLSIDNVSLYAGTFDHVLDGGYGVRLAQTVHDTVISEAPWMEGRGFEYFSGWAPGDSGMYTLIVNGVNHHTDYAAYTGSLAISAVPEPETFALLLAGLAVVAGALRRKPKNSSASPTA
jgi:PEP-CTERM motif-containing protein